MVKFDVIKHEVFTSKNVALTSPKPLVRYYAYIGGASFEFDNEKDAKSKSHLVERFVVNQDELDQWRKDSKSLNKEVYEVFKKELLGDAKKGWGLTIPDALIESCLSTVENVSISYDDYYMDLEDEIEKALRYIKAYAREV